MNLARYADYWARMRGESLAAVFKEHRLSWADLNTKANAVAAALQQAGIGKGDRVGCLLNNCMEWVVTFVAVLRAGAILVPLNPRYGNGELCEIAAQTDCTALVSVAEHVGRINPKVAGRVADSGDIQIFPMKSDAAPISLREAVAAGGIPVPVETAADDVAVITFTSGSTGLPKGAMLTHRSIEAHASSVFKVFGWTNDERVLLLAPFAFTGGLICVYTPAYIIGGAIFIEETLDAERALAIISREKITGLTGVPILWERMAASPDFAAANLGSLKTATTGGAPVAEALLKQYTDKGVCVRQTYGCTEAGGWIAVPNPRDAIAKPWSCGWASPTLEYRVVDVNGRACAVGEAGEILLRGEQMFRGYWANPEATAEAWTNGWYRTGDLGKLDEAGCLQIADRKKNMVISGGVNVYPAEVERAMSGLDGVAEVVAFGMPDATWGERVVAVVHGQEVLDPQSIMKACRTALGAYKTPKEIIISSKPLPRTSTGKVPRNNLPQFYETLHGETRAVA